MKKTLLLFAACFFAATFNISAQSAELKKDRIIASYLFAFGNLPEQGEIDYWMTNSLSGKPLSSLISEHKKNIENNQELQDRAIKNSYQDVLGRVPVQSEIEAWRPSKLSYTELVERHIKFLKDYPGEFEKVINLTYKREFNRNAEKQEIVNWKSWGARPYFAIIQEHQKNKQSGMFSKKSTPKLNTDTRSGVRFKLDPIIIGEIKSGRIISTDGAGIISTDGAGLISEAGGSWISTNTGNLITGNGRIVGAN